MSDLLERGFRTALRLGLILLAVVVLGPLAERSEWFRAIDRVIARHRPAFLGGAILVTVVGFTAFMGTILYALITQDPGQGAGRSFGAEVSFREIKHAYRAQAWRTDRFWRLLFLTILGAAAMTLGAFGLVFVLGPALVRALVAFALLYALWRTSRAFAQI
ncbi:MAG: hypothetical protein QN141_03405 [Armatimonadota bacterium]|nr:hypothetical protein [Armatimonadota bacterium]MDR7451390.1 hypothetical protein [Armatimonadota bacterium]MDR7466460.1 hypothetical protein [Armatimonadota bacterium]MDR7493182.1 hypothetical protein [Armatimonadota bacterium]MDR7499465.1 hypothetical protein [Armatimonadota bacterium]